jgi:hypothetical protein
MSISIQYHLASLLYSLSIGQGTYVSIHIRRHVMLTPDADELSLFV